MITFLNLYIMWVLNANNVAPCQAYVENQGAIDGCFNPAYNSVYVSDKTERPKDFVLYHEIGHSIFLLNFDTALFSDKEVMADQFAVFIYTHKYPQIKGFQSQVREQFFSAKCDQECVGQILSIEIPDYTPPSTFSFNVRQ